MAARDSLPALLETAIKDGSVESRLELGIRRMDQKAQQRYPGGNWYVAREIEPQRVRDGKVRQFELAGDELEDDLVRRRWVRSLGEAHAYPSHMAALAGCALQGRGTPMHEREAARHAIGSGLMRLDVVEIDR